MQNDFKPNANAFSHSKCISQRQKGKSKRAKSANPKGRLLKERMTKRSNDVKVKIKSANQKEKTKTKMGITERITKKSE